jgi:hypothetical protein
MPWQEGEQYLDPHKGYTDLRGRLLLPGFVDTHVHYPQTEMIGAFGEQLLEWLTTYTFPVESQFADEAYAKEIAEFFIQQLVSNGTTTALVFCTLHPESVEALFTGPAPQHAPYRRKGDDGQARAGLPERRREAELPADAGADPALAPPGRLGYAITPRFAPTSSPELLAAVSLLREEFPDTWLQTHLSENPNEVAWVSDLWPEHERYLDVYHHYGLTGERSVFAAIHLHHSEWQCLHDTGSAVAFCPTCFSAAGCFACPPAGSTGCGWASAPTSARAPPSACCAPWERPTRSASFRATACAPARRFITPRWAARTPSGWTIRLATSRPAKRRILWLSTPTSRRCSACAIGAVRISTSSFCADDPGRRAQHQRDLGQRRAGVVNCPVG